MLHVRRFGTGPEVLALHGFSLTGEQFAPGAGYLNRTVVAPDLPGHGASYPHPTDVDRAVASVEDLLNAPGSPRPVIGYSQGARLALLAAVEEPSEISSLVLVSGSAGIRDPRERQARAERDHQLAERIGAIGIDAFIDSWTTGGITSTDHLSREYRAWDHVVRSENTARGLGSALLGYGQGSQPSVWDSLGDLTPRALLVVGAEDERYTRLNREMADLIPNAQLAIVNEAGHNPLADQPETTYGIISDFLG